MDKKQTDFFKRLLEARIRELKQNVVRTEEEGRSAEENDIAQDIADRASGSYQKEFLFHRSNNERHLLQMAEAALARIHDGSYGECVSCGSEINHKRLEAVPWARHCIACQEKLEKGELLEQTGD